MEEQTSTEKETTKEQQIAMNNQAEGSNADAEVENRKANEIVNEFNTLGGDGIIINLGLFECHYDGDIDAGVSMFYEHGMSFTQGN